MRALRLKLSIFALLSLAVIAAWLFIPSEIASVIIARAGYWAIFITLVFYVHFLIKYFKGKNLKLFLSKHWVGLLVALVGTLIVETHEPREFKVLYDEFSLSGTAMSMHYMREAVFPIRVHNTKDLPELLEAGVDKRPLLFPFAIACLHDLTGYRPGNVFILNGIVGFLTIFMIYYLGCRYGGWRMGVASAGLWLALPLFAQCATSGGYDALNVLMILVLWHFGREYLDSGERLAQNLFVFSGVLLAQVRYESILALFVVALIIVVKWYRERRFLLTWSAVLIPLQIFVPLMINAYFMRNPAFMQTDPGQAYFSLIYLEENIGKAVWYLFSVNFLLTNSMLLSALGVVSCAAFLVRAFNKWHDMMCEGDRILVFAIGGLVLANLFMIMCNFWGQLDDPTASRFALPLYMFFIITSAWFAGEIFKTKLLPTWIFLGIFVSFVVGVSAESVHSATRALVKARAYNWMLEKIQEPQYRNALVISQPVGPILYQHPAIPMDRAEANKWKIGECLKKHIYPEILVFEFYAVDYKTGKLISGDEDQSLAVKHLNSIKSEKTTLSAAFTRELIGEIRLRPSIIARLSRITGVVGDEAKPPEWYENDKPPYKSIWDFNRHIQATLP